MTGNHCKCGGQDGWGVAVLPLDGRAVGLGGQRGHNKFKIIQAAWSLFPSSPNESEKSSSCLPSHYGPWGINQAVDQVWSLETLWKWRQFELAFSLYYFGNPCLLLNPHNPQLSVDRDFYRD